MKVINILAVLFLVIPVTMAGNFGEGYSSSEPNGPSAIHFRAFTIYTINEACDKSQLPFKLKISPNPLQMKIGDRIHRSNVNENPSEIVIEAYFKDGSFLPAVPIIVNTGDSHGVIDSQSDWDYFEAVNEGEDELIVRSACTATDGVPVESRVRIIVTSGDTVPID